MKNKNIIYLMTCHADMSFVDLQTTQRLWSSFEWRLIKPLICFRWIPISRYVFLWHNIWRTKQIFYITTKLRRIYAVLSNKPTPCRETINFLTIFILNINLQRVWKYFLIAKIIVHVLWFEYHVWLLVDRRHRRWNKSTYQTNLPDMDLNLYSIYLTNIFFFNFFFYKKNT